MSRKTKTMYIWQGGAPSNDLVDAVCRCVKDYKAIKRGDPKAVFPPSTNPITRLLQKEAQKEADLFNQQITNEQAIAHLKAQGCYRIIKTTEVEV